MQNLSYDDTCEIMEIKSGKKKEVKVLQFKPEKYVTVSVSDAASKITMQWNPMVKKYVGGMAGLEFETTGPGSFTYRTRR